MNKNHIPAIGKAGGRTNKAGNREGTRMKKLALILPLGVLMVLMMAGGVNAATFNVTTGSTVSGILDINITTTGLNATDGSTLNCTVTGSSSSVGYTMTSQLAQNASVGADARNKTANFSLDTRNLAPEVTDFVLGGTCTNGTGSTESITSITLIVDNNNPTCVFDAALVSNEEYAPTQTWSVTAINATTGTLRFGSNSENTLTSSISLSGVVNTNTLTFTGNKQSVPMTTYGTVTASVSDGTDRATCVLQSITIDEGVPLKIVGALVATQGSGKTTGATSGGNNNLLIGALVVIGLLAYRRMKRR